jgi:hypothetical protein
MVWFAVFVVLCGFFLLLNLAAWRGRLDREAAQFVQSFKFSTGMFAAVLSAAFSTAVVWVAVFIYNRIFGS